jgi:diacylglycerol diphosphate phosphatase/phosphatidate phosphatase
MGKLLLSKRLRVSMQSFPSGHTSSTFAVTVFISLYLNGKFKTISDYSPTFWKLLIFVSPVLTASLIGGGLVVDRSHHATDVLAGAVIGTLCAFLAYRSAFAACWDPLYNHVPLAPESFKGRFSYSTPEEWAETNNLVVCGWWAQGAKNRKLMDKEMHTIEV